jgi:hypothetical protein
LVYIGYCIISIRKRKAKHHSDRAIAYENHILTKQREEKTTGMKRAVKPEMERTAFYYIK